MNEKTILGGAKKCANTHKSVRYRTLSTTDLVKMCLAGKIVLKKMLINCSFRKPGRVLSGRIPLPCGHKGASHLPSAMRH